MKFGEETYELDGIDRQMLVALQDDAKLSLKELGERVGLAAPSVMERLRKMESAGIITGYHAVVDARAVGIDVAAFIGVSVRNPQTIEAVEAWATAEAQVMECHHVTGSYSLLLKVKTRNIRALDLLIGSLRSIDGLKGTETMVVLSSHFERVNLPLVATAEDEATDRAAKRPRRRAS